MVGFCSWGEVNIYGYCCATCQAPVVWRVYETRRRRVLVAFLRMEVSDHFIDTVTARSRLNIWRQI